MSVCAGAMREGGLYMLHGVYVYTYIHRTFHLRERNLSREGKMSNFVHCILAFWKSSACTNSTSPRNRRMENAHSAVRWWWWDEQYHYHHHHFIIRFLSGMHKSHSLSHFFISCTQRETFRHFIVAFLPYRPWARLKAFGRVSWLYLYIYTEKKKKRSLTQVNRPPPPPPICHSSFFALKAGKSN